MLVEGEERTPINLIYTFQFRRELTTIMPEIPDFAAIILDMDGLVLDTEVTYAIAWRQAANALGFQLSEEFWLSLVGLQYQTVEEKIIDRCGTAFCPDEFRSLSAVYWRRYVDENGIEVKKGFHQLLKVITQFEIPYCLATNSRKINAIECLNLAGIAELFPILISRDDVEIGKPAPDIFLRAAETLAVDIRHCLVVEDSSAGIAAAASAGTYAILIPSILPVDPQTKASADLVLNSLHEVADCIRTKSNQK